MLTTTLLSTCTRQTMASEHLAQIRANLLRSLARHSLTLYLLRMTFKMTRKLAQTLPAAEQHEWFKQAMQRRALLRGGLVGAASIGAAVVAPALLGAPSAAAAAPPAVGGASLLAKAHRPAGGLMVPFGRHVAFGADPARDMSISWQTAGLVDQPFVRIGTSPRELSHKLWADLRPLVTPRGDIDPIDDVAPTDKGAVTQYYLHAAMNNLHPDQTYYYTVGHNGWDPCNDIASIRTFTTAAPGRHRFTFTAFGDEGVSYDAVRVTNLVQAQKPVFHLHAGDISYAESDGDGLITDSYDPRVWDQFFAQIEPVAASVPWQVAFGNHDIETWYSPDGYGGHYDRFSLTRNVAYYSFTYGNVAVLSLDANDVSNEVPANRGYSGGAQTAWLEQKLAGYRKDPNIDFIVAYFHHCAYCTCTAHSSEGGVRTHFVPLFDKYSVDLVINGHNHIYERTDPIKGGAATTRAPIGSTVHPAKHGTTYVTAGGAGSGLYEFSAPDSYEGSVDDDSTVKSYVTLGDGNQQDETVTWSRVRYTGYCLLVIDSEPATHKGQTSTLTLRGLSSTGAELDRLVLARTI